MSLKPWHLACVGVFLVFFLVAGFEFLVFWAWPHSELLVDLVVVFVVLFSLAQVKQLEKNRFKRRQLDLTRRLQTRINDLKNINRQLRREVKVCLRVEDTLRQQREMLKCIVSNIPYYMLWKDRNSVYLGCNDSFASLSGAESSQSIVGKTDYDLWPKQDARFFRACDEKVMSEGKSFLNVEDRRLCMDGQEMTLLSSKVPLVCKDPRSLARKPDEVMGVLVVCADISKRQKLADLRAMVLDSSETELGSDGMSIKTQSKPEEPSFC